MILGSLDSVGAHQKVKRPPGFHVVFVAIPLLLLGFFGYRVLRPFRRRRVGNNFNDQAKRGSFYV